MIFKRRDPEILTKFIRCLLCKSFMVKPFGMPTFYLDQKESVQLIFSVILIVLSFVLHYVVPCRKSLLNASFCTNSFLQKYFRIVWDMNLWGPVTAVAVKNKSEEIKVCALLCQKVRS